MAVFSLIVAVVVLAFVAYAFLTGSRTADDDSYPGSSSDIPSLATRDDSYPGSSSSTPTLATREQTITDEQVAIKEDQYQMFMFDLNRNAHITLDVDSLSGPEFEVWTMPEHGFRRWEKAVRSLLAGGEFNYFPELSASKIHRISRSGGLSAGRYYVVIDNSDFGEVSPPANFSNDELTVHVKITARY